MPTINSYAEADKYLSQPRCNKVDRPLASNVRLQRRAVGSIAVCLYGTDILVYHSNGAVTIDTGGRWTQTTFRRLNQFAPPWVPVIFRRANKLWLQIVVRYTPEKKQRCPCCHGALSVADKTLRALAAMQHGCRRLNTFSRQSRDGESCYECGGSGMVTVGGKPVYTEWNGEATTVSKGHFEELYSQSGAF